MSQFSLAPSKLETLERFYSLLEGGLRRGGLAPALALRMPAITEDVGKSRPCDSAAKGYIKNKLCLNEEKGNIEVRFNGLATNFAIRRTMANRSSKQQQQELQQQQQLKQHTEQQQRRQQHSVCI